MSSLKIIRYLAWGLVAVALVLGGALLFTRLTAPRTDAGGESIPGFVPVTIGGPFTLTDENGQTVTETALAGHPSMVFFGYTNCPDICPTTLLTAPTWLDAVKAELPDLAFYFVTIDPERDTVDVMREYLAHFDPRIVGLTGTPEAIASVLGAYRVYKRVVPREGDRYDLDHTAPIYLMDRSGAFSGEIIRPEDEATDELVLAKLRRLGAG